MLIITLFAQTFFTKYNVDMDKDFAYGCIIIKDGQILLEKQKHKDERFWSFPKGHKEGNETDEEAALREIKEEVGLDVKIIDSNPVKMEYDIYSEDGEHRKIHKTVLLFFAEILGDASTSLQEAEVEAVEFVPLSEVEKKLTFDAAKTAWREAIKRL